MSVGRQRYITTTRMPRKRIFQYLKEKTHESNWDRTDSRHLAWPTDLAGLCASPTNHILVAFPSSRRARALSFSSAPSQMWRPHTVGYRATQTQAHSNPQQHHSSTPLSWRSLLTHPAAMHSPSPVRRLRLPCSGHRCSKWQK